MGKLFDAIKISPHPEERLKGASRRTHHGDAAVLALSVLVVLGGCNFSGRPESESASPPAPSTVARAEPAAGNQGPGNYSAFAGDTVYGVAQRFGVPVRMLIETNALKPPYRLAPGQQLRVPVREEHVVQSGDSLMAISRIYGVDQSSLARANNLKPPYGLKPGQRLVLPGRIDANLAMAPSMVEAPTSPNAATGSMSVEELPAVESAPPPSVPDAVVSAPPKETPAKSETKAKIAAIPDPPPRTSARFLWPVQGEIVSGFGAKKGGLHNDGVNIAAPAGTEVVAAENGVVAYAGNELRGFGNLLLIRHADGWVTAYAHNEKLLVKQGEKVTRGQPIARVGNSGNVSSPQLHFEIRKGTDPVDPLGHLAARG
jgi:murein DD-endopeptidase MepM/ murein hydrolase activator NlpD